MKKRQLFIYLMSFLFVMIQAQSSKENNFLTLPTASNVLKSSLYKKKITPSINKVQNSKTINVATAGTLSNLLVSAERGSITNLTITGNLDARDFKLIRDSLALLEVLDLSAVNIRAYTGEAGTFTDEEETYPANEIPDYAFFKMDVEKPNRTLKSIVFPVSATSIGEGAFALCTGFSFMTIPATISVIEDMAFVGFYGSFMVDSNNPNYSALDGVLMDKSKETVIQFPVLKGESYIIPSTVKTIGQYAFYGCDLLKSINIPASVTSIGDYAFFSCTGLTSMTVNARPEKIEMGNSCFYEASTSSCVLHVPFGTTTIFRNADQWRGFVNISEDEHGFVLNTSSMMFSNNNSTAKVIITTNDIWSVSSDQTWITLNKSSGSGTDTIQISASANPTTNNRIATLTFSIDGYDSQNVIITQSGLPKVINTVAGKLSTSMTASELNAVINLKLTGTIDARDFKAMRDNMPKLAFLDLNEVNIVAYNGSEGTVGWVTTYPANRIPDYAFNLGMSSQQFTLTMLNLPASITEVGQYAFYSCEALTEITIPNSVTFIGEGAFGSCNKLANVTLSDQLTSIEALAFTGGSFSSIAIPNTVKSIGYDAFSFCKKLKSITIPNSVTSIANRAFQYCSELSDLNLGNSVTTIGNSAFSNCSALRSVNIPNSVTLLDGSAFSYCTSLKEVNLSNSLTSISSGCFHNCTNLVSINIPNSVTNIEYSAFSYCKSLANIIFPSSVVSIGNEAFSFCGALKTIDIPNSVTKLGSYAFSECSSLDSIYVNRDVPLDLSNSQLIFYKIDKNACILHVPFGTKNLYSTANQWKDFSNIAENIHGFALSTDTLELLSTEGSSANVSVKSNEQWVVSSGETWLKISPENGTGNDTLKITADANMSSLQRTAFVTVTSGEISKTIAVFQLASPKEVNIVAGGLVNALSVEELNTITNLTISGTINARDFKIMRDSMPSLKAVNIRAANVVAYTGKLGTAGNYNYSYLINEIPRYAFFNSNNYTGKTTLKSIVLPVSITSIGNSAFEYCSGLTEIDIPDLVISIGNSAFERCSGLSEIKGSKSLQTISGDAFKNCSALNGINFPNSLKSIADNAFQYCSGLTSLVIPDSVSALNWYTFANCTNLTTVTLGKSLSSLNYAVFRDCTALKVIVMTNALKTIGDNTFANTGLTNLLVPKSVTSIGYSAFDNCKELTEVILPDSLNLIGSAAFRNCSELKRITLGNQLNTIKSEAFYNCINLTNMVIPESVIAIEGSAFYNCKGLQSITANPLIPVELSGSSNVFSGVDKTKCILNVPYQSKILYSIASQWRDFVSILENPNGLKLDVYAARIRSSAGSSINVNVFSNTLWSAVSDQSWLTLSSGSGSGNKLITLSADENSGNIARRAIVTVSVAGVPDQIITVTQSAAAKSVQVTTGNLYASLTQEELNTVSNLILTGTIDARDFKTMRDNMPLLADVDLSGTTIVAYTGNAGTYAYSATYPAATIPQYAFYSYMTSKAKLTLKSIVLPSSTVSIDIFAFQNCSGLFAVSLPETLTSINDFAFRYCTGLGEISFPNSLLTLGQYSFYNCAGIKKLSFGNSLNTINNYAFSTCTALRSVKLPNSLTTIGNYVFEKCNSLTDISFGSSMSTTGVSTFSGCKGIKSIVLPNSITTIGSSCFESCTNLKQVTFGNSLATISIAAFSSCTNLDNVVMPNTVTLMDFRAFMDCDSLKNITLSNSLKAIGGSAFSSCIGLTDILIPNSVTTIGDGAFSNCSSLKNIKFSNRLTKIEGSAFSNCTGLVNVDLPKTVTEVGMYAFNGCSGMKSITIPAGISSLEYSSISTGSLTAIYSLAEVPITPNSTSVFSYVDKTTCVLYVPAGSKSVYQATPQWKDFNNISEDFGFVLENKIIRIKSGANYMIDFQTDKTFTVESDEVWLKAEIVQENGKLNILLTSDINPNIALRTASVKISFANGPIRTFTIIQSGTPKAVNLSSGNLRTSLTALELNTVSNLILTGTIDARDFRIMRDSMPQLADVDMKDVTITAYSGSEGTNPGVSLYPENQTPINAFYYTYSGIGKETLTNVILPANITAIGKSSFAYANGLETITIPDQVTLIGETAFARCEGLKTVTIGNSVKTIDVEAFYICTKLSEVTIPNSVTTLSKEAFSSCYSLKSINFSNNLTTIGADAFVACRSLTNVEIPNSVTTIETGAFRYCHKLARVVLPATLTELKYDVFYHCELLKEIKLPETLKIIGPEAFAYCSGLGTISIPASVNNIGYNAFSNCTSLSSIYAYPVSPVDLTSTSLSSNVFSNVNKTTCKLYVPTGTKTLYVSAIQWKDFTNIIEMNTAVPTLKDLNISIYPNPVKDFFSIDGLTENIRVLLTDINGKELLDCQINAGESVSISHLAKGVYVIRIVTSEDTVKRKLIKE